MGKTTALGAVLCLLWSSVVLPGYAFARPCCVRGQTPECPSAHREARIAERSHCCCGGEEDVCDVSEGRAGAMADVIGLALQRVEDQRPSYAANTSIRIATTTAFPVFVDREISIFDGVLPPLLIYLLNHSFLC